MSFQSEVSDVAKTLEAWSEGSDALLTCPGAQADRANDVKSDGLAHRRQMEEKVRYRGGTVEKVEEGGKKRFLSDEDRKHEKKKGFYCIFCRNYTHERPNLEMCKDCPAGKRVG